MRRAVQILCFLPENSRMSNSSAEFDKVSEFVDKAFGDYVDDSSKLFRILNTHRSVGVVTIDEESGRFEHVPGKLHR